MLQKLPDGLHASLALKLAYSFTFPERKFMNMIAVVQFSALK